MRMSILGSPFASLVEADGGSKVLAPSTFRASPWTNKRMSDSGLSDVFALFGGNSSLLLPFRQTHSEIQEGHNGHPSNKAAGPPDDAIQ